MKFHVIAGLPRSGSTILANLLAQHPDVYVSSTSPLSAVIEACTSVLSNNAEVTAMLANVPESEQAFHAALRGLIQGWYSTRKEKIIIDKGRGWAQYALLLNQLYPSAKMIITVRDPRDVVASIERQHRKTAIFDSPLGRTVYEAAEQLMLPDGMVGGPMRFVEDLIRRRLPNVEFVRYETFTREPEAAVAYLASALKLPKHKLDVKNIKNQSTDLDALYRGKYPHDAAGAIKPSQSTWADVIDPQLAQLIAERYPLYMKKFDYL